MPISNKIAYDIIIFDLDGTLLEGRWRHYFCYADILREHHFTPLDIDAYWHMKKSRIDIRIILEQSNAESIYDLFLQLWLSRIESRFYLKHDFLHENAKAILEFLEKKNIKMFLVTLRHHELNLRWQLKRLGISSLFSKIIAVNDAKNKSEAVCLYIKNFQKSCLWVGDTELDVQAARSLDIPIAALSCGLRTADYLASLKPDYLYTNLQKFIYSVFLNSNSDIITL